VPLVWVVSRRADHAAADRERLLVMAAEASDAERRRVARDLHDGVVQDLAGTSFALSGLAREVSEPRLGTELERLASAVRGSLLALRSLLVEIYPPQLDAEGLGAALQDLLAPARQAGIDVELQIDGAERLSDQTTALIWRTAQECVRNAVRHAEPNSLRVSVAVADATGRASLSVADDGRGFDAETVVSQDRFGLRGLRDLARESGGTLTVVSEPGQGTVVILEVPVR
jgi:signal transduction histidine kinase